MPVRRRLAALAAAAVVVALAGCAPAVTTNPTHIDDVIATPTTIVSGGIERSYQVRVPDSGPTSTGYPLLVMIHGAGGNAVRAETVTGFTTDADADGFIVAYPNGTQAATVAGELAWNADGCCANPARDGVDDVAFISAMVDAIEDQYPVDPARIYLAGFSNGGMLSYRLACELGDRFAGIAVVSGALNVSRCPAPSPMNVLIIHGTGDLTVPYDGGEPNLATAARFGTWDNTSVAYATEFWRGRDECDEAPVATATDELRTEIFEGCTGNSHLEVLTIIDGTHTWPRTGTFGLDGTQAILEFFGLTG